MGELKEKLYEDIKKVISSWTEEDIYAISFFVTEGEGEIKKPGLSVGYNTETNYKECIPFARNKDEARWDFSFWLQNNEYEFGYTNEDEQMLQKWMVEAHLDDYKGEDAKIFFSFNTMLKEIASEFHQEGFLREKFQKDMPIRIHDFELCYFTVLEKDVVQKKSGDTDYLVGLFKNLKSE